MFSSSDDIQGTKLILFVCSCLGKPEKYWGQCLDLISDVSTLEIEATAAA